MLVFFRFILKLKSDLVKSDLDPTILIENFDHVTVKSLIKYLYYDSGNIGCRVSERGIKSYELIRHFIRGYLVPLPP